MEVEEDNEVCDICREGYSEPGDMLVFCDRCNIAVHQGCYGIKEVPEGDWFCKHCRDHMPALPEGESPKTVMYGWGRNDASCVRSSAGAHP